MNGMLIRAADWGTNYLLQRDRFFHHNFGGRITDAGYVWSNCNENIAWISRRSEWSAKRHVARISRNFYDSQVHRDTMLEPLWVDVGISVKRGSYECRLVAGDEPQNCTQGTVYDVYFITELYAIPQQ